MSAPSGGGFFGWLKRLFGGGGAATVSGLNADETRAVQDFSRHLGIHFHEPRLLCLALTHRSFLHIQRGTSKQSNERLEFLGDSVLGLIVSEHLYKSYPNEHEGQLTKTKSLLVSKAILSRRALAMGLGRFVLMSNSEVDSGGRQRLSILADAFESVLGAIYLDQGLEAARKFVETWLLAEAKGIVQDKRHTNYKSLLQEYVQSAYHTHPQYSIRHEHGPDHSKLFTIEVRVGNKMLGSGKGKNKKEAEQVAARDALDRVAAESGEKSLQRQQLESRPEREGRPERRERSERVPRAERAERAPRAERAERAERSESMEHFEHMDRGERAPRGERSERAERPERAERRERPERAERGERMDRPDRSERHERPERADRPERPARSERPEREGRAERAERPERAERAERAERPEREARAERPERGERREPRERTERAERPAFGSMPREESSVRESAPSIPAPPPPPSTDLPAAATHRASSSESIDLSGGLVWESPSAPAAPPTERGRFGRQPALKTTRPAGTSAPAQDPNRRSIVSESPASAPRSGETRPETPETPRRDPIKVDAEVREVRGPLPGVDATRYRAAESPAARFSSETPTAWDEDPKEHE